MHSSYNAFLDALVAEWPPLKNPVLYDFHFSIYSEASRQSFRMTILFRLRFPRSLCSQYWRQYGRSVGVEVHGGNERSSRRSSRAAAPPASSLEYPRLFYAAGERVYKTSRDTDQDLPFHCVTFAHLPVQLTSPLPGSRFSIELLKITSVDTLVT